MIDLHERFAQLDGIETEDLWREIEFRYEQEVERVPYPIPRTPRRGLAFAGAAAAIVLVFIGLALLLSSAQKETPPVITQAPPTPNLSGPSTTLPGPSTTLPAPPAGSLAEILEWSLIRIPGEVEVECSEDPGQLDELCITPYGTVLRDIITFGDRLWAVGYDGSTGTRDAIILSSNDGEGWQRIPDPNGVLGGPGNQQAHAIAAGDGKLIAVGSTDCVAVGVDYPSGDVPNFVTDPVGQCPKAWIYEDDAGWETRSIESITTRSGAAFEDSLIEGTFAPDPAYTMFGYPMRDVVWTGDEFVAVGEAIWTSPDGYAWTMDALPSTSGRSDECSPECRANTVLVTGEVIIAVGKDPTLSPSAAGGKAGVWVSSQAGTWSQLQPDLPAYSEILGIIEAGDGYLAFGQASGVAWTAPVELTSRGSSYESVDLRLPPTDSEALRSGTVATGNRVNDAVVVGDRLVAVGFQLNSRYLYEGGAGRVWVSPDEGFTWTLYPTDDFELFGAYSSSSFGAEMRSAAVYDGAIIAVGSFNTDAAVWIGTWTD